MAQITGTNGNDNGFQGKLLIGKNDSDDTIFGLAGNDFLFGLSGNDTLDGGADNDSLRGDDGNDFLDGGAGNDLMEGGAGNDFLAISDGTDSFNGGDGFDTLGMGQGFFEKQILTSTTLRSIDADGTNGATNITFANIEKAKLSGNFIDASAAQIPVEMIGGFNGVGAELRGGSGDDTIGSGNSIDRIEAGNGNNRVESFDGNDTIISGSGNDTLIGGNGNDFIDSGDGNDTLLGGSGDDSIQSGDGKDSLEGGDGNDNLQGGSGVDLMKGGNGNDIYRIEDVGDKATETSAQGGIDTVNSSVSFTLGSNLEELSLFGSSNINGTGNGLSNFIGGNTGNNTLKGGSNNDTLAGAEGKDILTGGTGSDRFLFASTSPFSTADFGVDRITDFAHATDDIVLDKRAFTALKSVAGDGFSVASDFAAVSSDALAATSKAVITYSTGTGHLFYNQNGTAAGLGSGGQFADLSGLPTVSAGDFVIL